LLKNMCSRTRSLLIIGKRRKYNINIFSIQYKRCKQKTHQRIWIKRRKHSGIQVGQNYQRLRCPQNQLCHKICLLFLTNKLCLWNIYSKISVNKWWRLPIPWG
jgi:hypothetical protein